MKKKYGIIFLFLVFFVCVSCAKNGLSKKNLTIKKSDGTEITVRAELAITPEQRQFGYMERTKIPDGTGMLFVFENDQILSFWMKNTPHPLSIAYISKDGTIKDIFDMTPFSLASIVSTSYVRYALEVPQGWFEKQNIKKGDVLLLDF